MQRVTSRARWWRITPVLFVTYSFAYLDRVNYSFAAAGGIATDLGISAATSSLIGALFFLGYFIGQVPGAIYAERRNVVSYFEQAGPVTLALNIVMMAIAWGLARGFRLGRRQGIAIVLECGLQNATVAIVVAGTLIGDSTITIPGAIYGLLLYATGGLFVYAVTRQPAAVGQSA